MKFTRIICWQNIGICQIKSRWYIQLPLCFKRCTELWIPVWKVRITPKIISCFFLTKENGFIEVLYPHAPLHFAWQITARISQNYGPPNSVTWMQLQSKQMNTGTSTTLTAEIIWSTRTTLGKLQTCDFSLGLLMTYGTEAGHFV